MRRPIVLIGLPGAGKTTVAPYAAGLLGSAWCDLDEQIAVRAGKSIADIFASDGERHFRALERAAMVAALAGLPQVIGTGGGWAAEPDNIAAIAGRTLLIYLALTPAEAASRLAGTGDRPMLVNESPVSRLTELLNARERWYRLADIEIAVGQTSVETVAASIAAAARRYGGW